MPGARISVPADRRTSLRRTSRSTALRSEREPCGSRATRFGRTVWRIDPATKRVVATIALPFVPGGDRGRRRRRLGDVTARRHRRPDRPGDERDRRRRSTSVAGPPDRGRRAGPSGSPTRSTARSRASTRTTNRVVATIPVGNAPGRIVADGGAVWVTTAFTPTPRAPGRASIPIGRARGLSRPLLGVVLRRRWRATELALLERGGKRAGPAVDGRRRRRLDRRPADQALPRLLGHGRPLRRCPRLGGWSSGVGVRILIGPLAGNEGLALQEYARRRPAMRS